MSIYTRLCNAYDTLAYLESAMMPNTDMVTNPGTAEEQYNKIFKNLDFLMMDKTSTVAVSSLSNYKGSHFTGMTNNIEAYAQVFLDSRFDLEIIHDSTSYSYDEALKETVWKGKIRITQHTDKNNVYPVDTEKAKFLIVKPNDDELEFAKQKALKALSSSSMADIDFDIAGMKNAKEIRQYFKKYSLHRLEYFRDGYDACLSVLTEMGLAASEESDIYNRYYELLRIISNPESGLTEEFPDIGVLETRQAQVDAINTWSSQIQEEQKIF